MKIRVVAAVFLLAACARSEPPGPADEPAGSVTRAGVDYRAETRVLESFPVQLRTVVTLTNRTDGQQALQLPDGCAVLLRAYREVGAARPVWDQAGVLMCTMALQEVALAAGGSRTFEARSDAREILGDSLPDGTYRLTAYLRPNGGEVEVPAGTVQLAVPR